MSQSQIENRNSKIAEGFILAGGRSLRMGREKALLEIGGETFLARAARNLGSVFGTVTVVLSADSALETDLPVVRDEFPGRGALGGLHAALKNCNSKLAIVLAVDLPLITPDAVANLATLAESLAKFLAVVPRQSDGRPQPLFAAYRAKFCVRSLEEVINENPRASVKDFLDRIAPKYIDPSRLSADPDLLTNVNTAEEFEEVGSEQ